MDAHHTPVDVDPQELERARSLWHGFTGLAQKGIIAIVILLLAMGYFLV